MKVIKNKNRSPWSHRWVLILISCLPGALAGANLSALFFFINPSLPFNLSSVGRTILFFSPRFMLLSLVIHLPWLIWRPRKFPRVLPWSLTIVFALVALVDAYQASYFAFYLPPGINRRLIKAALWLTLAAIISLYTALLHSLKGRRYGLRSQIMLWVLALGSLYSSVERREAFQPTPSVDPFPSRLQFNREVKLLFIGIDAATLDAFLPLARQGDLPFFNSMLDTGFSSRLNSISPYRSEALWTSISSGKLPYQHGIKGSVLYSADFLPSGHSLRLLPKGLGLRQWRSIRKSSRPVDSTVRHSLLLWETFSLLNAKAGVVNWPNSFPPPRTLNQPQSSLLLNRPRRTNPVISPPDSYSQSEIESFSARVPPHFKLSFESDLSAQMDGLNLLRDHPSLRATFVRFGGLLPLSRAYFGGFLKYQHGGSTSTKDKFAHEVITSYCGILDRFVEDLWNGIEGDKVLFVVSPHGMGPEKRLLKRSIQGRINTSPDGMWLIGGKGVRPEYSAIEANVTDVAPTLLYWLGLPVPKDMEGVVLTDAIAPDYLAAGPMTFLQSYEFLNPSLP